MLPPDVDERLATWLSTETGTEVRGVHVTRLAAGHSSGAWRLDLDADPALGPLVLKAPILPSVVHRRDACREARLMAGASDQGAPVPAVVAIDPGTEAAGRPCFVMAFVEGDTINDEGMGGAHVDPALVAAGPSFQRRVWESFHDALAALHRVDPGRIPEAARGPNGSHEVLGYWREALLDAAPPEQVPRQLAVLDALAAHVPTGADASPALCMGDARLVNGLLRDGQVVGLVDFEVAYVGNPAADIGYSLFMDLRQRASVDEPLGGFASADETWQRWEISTGRSATDRAYWTAFGATILVITATRAMVQWGLAGPSVEDTNPLIDAWEDALAVVLGG